MKREGLVWAMACSSWQEAAESGRKRQKVAESGRKRHRKAEGGRKWQKVAELRGELFVGVQTAGQVEASKSAV